MTEVHGIEVRELPPDRDEVPLLLPVAQLDQRAREIQRAYERGRAAVFEALLLGAVGGGLVGVLVGLFAGYWHRHVG